MLPGSCRIPEGGGEAAGLSLILSAPHPRAPVTITTTVTDRSLSSQGQAASSLPSPPSWLRRAGRAGLADLHIKAHGSLTNILEPLRSANPPLGGTRLGCNGLFLIAEKGFPLLVETRLGRWAGGSGGGGAGAEPQRPSPGLTGFPGGPWGRGCSEPRAKAPPALRPGNAHPGEGPAASGTCTSYAEAGAGQGRADLSSCGTASPPQPPQQTAFLQEAQRGPR